MMVIDNKFGIGDIVFVKTDVEQLERIVTGIYIKPQGLLVYVASMGCVDNEFYEIELATEKDILKTL